MTGMQTRKRDVILYIAMSIDGYIADTKGSIAWISGQDRNVETEDTFTLFFQNVDTVIMGRTTYNQIVNELSPNEWPYIGTETFVITHDENSNGSEHICFCNTSVCRLVTELKKQSGKDIWICGGALIARQLIAEDLIDTYHLAIIPVILGGGIRLFDTTHQSINLSLDDTKQYNGIIELTYNRRYPNNITPR